MEPFAEIVGGTPGPSLVNCEKPCVVAFAEFGQRFLATVAQKSYIMIQVVTLDSLTGWITKLHRYHPILERSALVQILHPQIVKSV